MITFRPLASDDFELLHRWLNEPGVIEWWEGDDVSEDAVRRDYFTNVEAGVEHWLALDDGEPFGWLQCYSVLSDLEECGAWFEFGVPETAAGIDYLVGEPGERGQGRGSSMIRAFTNDIVFGIHPDWTHSCAGPFSANRASWGALARAGYEHIGTVLDPAGPCHLMMCARDAESN